MEFENKPYGVYVKIDETNRIIDINSDAFLLDLTDWIKVDEGYGDKHHHAQGNYLPGPLTDERGIYRYKLMDDEAVERTTEEMDTDYVEPVIEQQVEELLLEMAAEYEYRLCLIELGVTENDL